MGAARAVLPGRFPAFNCDLPVLGQALLLLGVTVSDVLYVGLTIVVFAVLFLIVRGVERFER